MIYFTFIGIGKFKTSKIHSETNWPLILKRILPIEIPVMIVCTKIFRQIKIWREKKQITAMSNQKSANTFIAETEAANHVQVQNSKIITKMLTMEKVLYCPLAESLLACPIFL